MTNKPVIAAHEKVAELSLRSVILGILLTLVLATANAYLALKLGILTSASIPAAIISMGILRFFKHPGILENNAVQTAASAGEAVAGGIVYTIPALIIIGFWDGFDYWTNFFIAATGGVLGVLFSIPLRRILVHDEGLKFPEGRAIAEVLKSSSANAGMSEIFMGGAIGALLELFQVGFKIIANSWNYYFVAGKSLFALGAGFSATMVGAGYLVGSSMALSIFSGAVIAWLVVLPVLSYCYPEILNQHPVQEAALVLWNTKLRYLGIGAMLFAGLWTLIKLIKPLSQSMRFSFAATRVKQLQQFRIPRTERDIPLPYIFAGIAAMAALLFALFNTIFPVQDIGFQGYFSKSVVVFAVLYVLVIGFVFSVITAYFSGMVGVTASPGSSVVIAGMLFAAWLLLTFINQVLPLPLGTMQLRAAEAITIIIGSVVTGIAAIANDNTQDLKVGQIVGATPWKQQIMLLLGVLISSLIIPPVMQLLFDVYGIAGVMPREGMDISLSLPAPTAALMAAITEAVFRNNLPWLMMFSGALIIFVIILSLSLVFKGRSRLSILGIAIGMYLPLTSSFPLFLGGMIAWFVQLQHKKQGLDTRETTLRTQRGTLIACGLVAGSAIMDVILAIPFSLFHSPNALKLVGDAWENYGILLAILSTFALACWMIRRVK